MTGSVVRIHPNLSLRYYEFYLKGLRSVFGDGLRFTSAGMPVVVDPKAGLAAITPDGTRIFIAANDMSDLDEEALEWCHVYGKVNLAHEEVGIDPRLLPIGPSFGIPSGSRAALVSTTLATSLRSRPREAPARLRDYWGFQSSRAPLSEYGPTTSDPDYIFLLASFWAKHPAVNPQRLQLFESLAEFPDLRVEGGFWNASALPSAYQPFALKAPIEHERYLALTGRSVVALNTAAVHACLGWKLGEYFALGKAIVTPPLTRAMPGGLEHGRELHITDGSPESALEAVARLRSDAVYRSQLEVGSRRYWERYLTPEAVVRRLVEHAQSI
jgi:hypothetical protein